MHVTLFRRSFFSRLFLLSAVVALLAGGLTSARAQGTRNFPVIGKIHRLDPALDELIPKDAKIEVLSSRFEWAEGPVWDKASGTLFFSDVIANQVMQWKEGEGVHVYLRPSGYTGPLHPRYSKEPGSNGLMMDREGRLISCEHGDRRLSVLTKGGGKRTLVDNYEGKRLNSPNDGCIKSNGDIYFTDPPYGLPQQEGAPRELDFCGVYRLATDGKLTLLTKEMTRPNGIAFSPDEKILYVAQSDFKAAIWKAFPVLDDGTLGPGNVFADMTSVAGKLPGLPDGMKVDAKGNLFATAPGGCYVFSPDGKVLGRIETGEKTANCAWGNDGSVLYLCADMYICRVKTTTKGAGW
ncbi:MAG TPA: SMP-30/gluconolactonase/LRE family protein [Planctomycetaceae bacterium]|jgi:gluconolactonase|nr:SMP-30/gluconolactonase/LRE family protein [Planctomycetaceae bacterium]